MYGTEPYTIELSQPNRMCGQIAKLGESILPSDLHSNAELRANFIAYKQKPGFHRGTALKGNTPYESTRNPGAYSPWHPGFPFL